MSDINELVAAMAKARAAFPAIEKTETATIKTKSGYTYSYDYAPLAEILDKTAAPLATNGLILMETIDDTESGTELTVTLAHSSGQHRSSKKLLGRFSDPKEFGGAMTYYRRYLIEGLLSIASQQDKDAQGIEASEAPRKIATKQAKTTNGNGAPTNPQALFDLVNSRVLVPYDHINHLFNAIRSESTLDDYQWPAADDIDGWRQAYTLAKDHANKKTNEAAQ